jgi:copper(I)-binding protein
MNKTSIGLSVAILTASSLAAHAHSFSAGKLSISHPWARETAQGQKVGGGFMVIRNAGKKDDRLVSATTPAAAEVQMHTMSMDNGVMRMRQLRDGIAIPAGQTVELKPGSLHIMFMGLKAPFVKGTKVPVTLRFEKAGAVKVAFAIQPVGSTGPMEMKHEGR